MYEYLKKKTREILFKKTRALVGIEKLKKETESLQIATQNNAIRTNYVKSKIDKTQHNIMCWLCVDRDETMNHIINKCSKLAQKETEMDRKRHPLGVVQKILI